jgi:predicted DsbA family dithiol-disulfide isomerase
MAMVIDIDIVSDVICPWCFVGKKRLEKAMAAVRGKHRFRVRWKPFQLNPDMPKEGMARLEYRRRKFGSEQVVAELDRRMTGVGKEVGIPFALDRIQKTPNTFDAHRLIWWAEQNQAQDVLVDGLFRAFFTQGRDIGDRGVLADVAGESGLNRADAAAFLKGDLGAPEVSAEEGKARTFGVEAVPFFVLGGRVAVAGAHPSERFVEAFDGLERSSTAP